MIYQKPYTKSKQRCGREGGTSLYFEKPHIQHYHKSEAPEYRTQSWKSRTRDRTCIAPVTTKSCNLVHLLCVQCANFFFFFFNHSLWWETENTKKRSLMWLQIRRDIMVCKSQYDIPAMMMTMTMTTKHAAWHTIYMSESFSSNASSRSFSTSSNSKIYVKHYVRYKGA